MACTVAGDTSNRGITRIPRFGVSRYCRTMVSGYYESAYPCYSHTIVTGCLNEVLLTQVGDCFSTLSPLVGSLPHQSRSIWRRLPEPRLGTAREVTGKEIFPATVPAIERGKTCIMVHLECKFHPELTNPMPLQIFDNEGIGSHFRKL